MVELAAGESIPHAIPFGTALHRPTPVGDVPGGSEWVLNAGTSLFLWKHGPEVVQQVQSLILRILSQFPPGMARFVFVDPLGAGKGVAPFLHLTDYDEGLVGGKVWSENTHIEERLQELQAHIEMVVQKYLRGQFDDIEAHNAAAGEIAEAYRFLIIFDFPAGFSRRLLAGWSASRATGRPVAFTRSLSGHRGARCLMGSMALNWTDRRRFTRRAVPVEARWHGSRGLRISVLGSTRSIPRRR